MRVRSVGISLAAVLLAVATLAAREKPEWYEGRTAHFHVLTNGSQKKAQELTQKLEAFRHLYVTMYPDLRVDPPVPTTVIFFKNDKSMTPYKPLTPEGKPRPGAGFFQASLDRMFLVINPAAGDADQTTFHEYVHLLLHLSFERIPLWLDEGLAMFYQRSDVEGADISIGYPLTDYWVGLQEQKLIPLGLMFRVDHASEYYNQPEKQNIFYGQSWLLVHYLVAGNQGKRQPAFARFLEQLHQDVPQEQAFVKAFGVDLKQMKRELEDYLREPTVNFYRGRLKKPAEKHLLEVRPLDGVQATVSLTDLWIASGRREEAEKVLAPLARSAAAPPEALYRLGRLALERREFAQAEEYLRAALVARPDDISLRYYAAWAVSQNRLTPASAPEERRAAAGEIIQLLAPVLTAGSSFIAAFDLQIQAQLARDDPPEDVIPVAERARDLMPQRHEFHLLLAYLYMRQRRWQEAEAAAQRVVAAAPSDLQRSQAQETWQQIQRARAFEENRQVIEQNIQLQRRSEDVRPPAEPVEPPPAPAPAEPPKARYLRGKLVSVACSEDTAVLTIQAESKEGAPPKTVRLLVRSVASLLVLGSAGRLDCRAAGVIVAVNYILQPDASGSDGIVMTISFPASPR